MKRKMARANNKERRIKIFDNSDIGYAVSEARQLAEEIGFTNVQQFMIATSVSELCTNTYRYAAEGEITIRIVKRKTGKGIEIIAKDNGPGIPDVEKAMRDGFSTSKSLGIGLPGVKRLMDEFEIDTKPGIGTRISVRKWRDEI